MTTTRRVQTAIVLMTCAAAAYAFAAMPGEPMPVTALPVAAEGPITEAEKPEPASEQQAVRFRHSDPQHARMPCLVCHKRAEGLTTPRWPGHLPCAGCHQQQFGDSSNAMCTVCHTTPGAAALKRFPPQRSFTAKYDHARHARQTSCSTCHAPNRRGAGLSVPSGVGAHATCFRCHGPQTEIGGRNIGSCGTCHTPGSPVRNSDWSRAYSMNFSHAEHTRKGLACASCHTVRPGQGRGRQVTEPALAMHFPPGGTSCASCHNGKRAFGIDSFQNCRRCHEGNTFRF